MADRVLPENIDYSRVLPLSVPALSKRHKFYPTNGSTFNAVGNNEIRIPLPSTNALLDPTHSYIEMEVFLQNPVFTCGMDLGGGANIFSAVRLEQGGKVICDSQSYNRLHASVLTMTQSTRDGLNTEGLTGAGRANNGAGGNSVAPRGAGLDGDNYTTQNHNADTALPAQQGVRITMPITLGLFTQNKLIPLPLIDPNNPITIVLVVDDPANMGCWSANPGLTGITLFNCAYVAQLVEVGRDVIDQFRGVQEIMGGQLVISGQDWEHGVGVVPAATAGTQIAIRMPTRKRSIKSLFWTASDGSWAGGAGGRDYSTSYNLSFAGNCSVDSWQIKVGSVVYPPTPIEGWGDGAIVIAPGVNDPKGARGESVMELAKAFGTLGYTNPTGYLSTLSYGTGVGAGLSNGDNTNGVGVTFIPGDGDVICTCPFGIDLESFQRTAIESGVDTQTLSQETNLLLNINGVGASLVGHDKTINMWVLYDQHYYFNDDGSLTFSN